MLQLWGSEWIEVLQLIEKATGMGKKLIFKRYDKNKAVAE